MHYSALIRISRYLIPFTWKSFPLAIIRTALLVFFFFLGLTGLLFFVCFSTINNCASCQPVFIHPEKAMDHPSSDQFSPNYFCISS